MPEFRASKPAFSVSQSASQAIAAGAQNLVFDTLDYETAPGWDGISAYTVDRPGLYLIHVQAGRAAVASSSTIIVRARVNASTRQSFQSITTVNGIVAAVTTLEQLEGGDIIEGQVTFHATLASTTNAAQTRMWASRIGPKRWTG